jgi:hypothetical protein
MTRRALLPFLFLSYDFGQAREPSNIRKITPVRNCSNASSCVNWEEGTDAQWAAYLRGVYGEPVDPSIRRELEWVYSCHGRLPCSHVPSNDPPTTVVPKPIRIRDETRLGEAFIGISCCTDGLHRMSNWGFFVRRDALRPAAASGTWVEVFRARRKEETPFSSTWYYAARGTGIFINVGRTISMEIADSHDEQAALVARARTWDTTPCNSTTPGRATSTSS